MAMFEEIIRPLAGQTDVIILPEMFTTGFSMRAPELAEHMNMRTTRWMRQMADHTDALILGSIIAHVHDRFYNRLIWMEPGGNVRTYDKRHLFRMSNEHLVYTPDESLLIGNWKGWNICPLVCYDLRFPVWSRNRWQAASQSMMYDLLVYVANWPTVRIDAWETLIRARGIENLCYVAGVNRIGQDGNAVEYNGKSSVISPRGEIITTLEGVTGTPTVTLSANALKSYRERFPAWLDADTYNVDLETITGGTGGQE